MTAELRAAGCVFAADEARLLRSGARGSAELRRLADRRIAGEPLEHVLGWAEFCGRRIAVDRGVFVPRARTELLARAAIDWLRKQDVAVATAVELCCGAAPVATTIAAELPAVRAFASDIDQVAVRCACRNLGPERVFEGDLYEALPRSLRGSIDVVAVNAPYVPSDAVRLMPHEAREHEPLRALDGGPDGLDVHRRVVAEAATWLAPGGVVLIETSRDQAPLTAQLMIHAGLAPRVVTDDELEATVVLGGVD